jgi:K+-sensing histidine kinase KdpD
MGITLVKRHVLSALYSCLGVAISTFCAIVLAKLYTGTEWKFEAPLLFAVALVILASHFGAVISLSGSLIAAAVFAFLLYNPANSLQVASETDRSTLAWMILISTSLSYLLYPTRENPKDRNGRNGSSVDVEERDLSREPHALRSPGEQLVGPAEVAKIRSSEQEKP